MLFETIGSFLVERLYHFLPRWLERRMLPPANVQKEIRIDLRRQNPVSVQGGEVPTIWLWFEISNLSQIDITLDRLLFDVWFGQPTLRGAILGRAEIAKRSTATDIHFWTALDAQQVAQIKRYLGNPLPEVTVNFSAYFESRIGWLTVQSYVRHEHVSVTGL